MPPAQINKVDDWHRERRIGKAVKAGIKCFCGSKAYRDILEVVMNCETFPRVHRIFCPNCGLQMRSPAGNDDDFIVRKWRDIIDMHQHQKDGEIGIKGVSRTPEQISKLKSGLKACKNHPVIYYACDDLQCPYAHEGGSEHMECHHRLAADAWAYIRELERRRDP